MTNATASMDALTDMIEICIDGQKGFEAAAKAVDDPTIKDELVGYSWQRQQFANDLKSRMKALGEDPPEHGSASGAMHRGWMGFKSALGANDSHAILAECERGEDVAEEVYRRAMSSGLPAEYGKVVSMQYQTIQRTHDRIKALRDATEKKN